MNSITFYLRLAVVNFIILTMLGLVLRYIHIGSLGSVNYQFLLHSHSHFAFSGWMFFAIVLLIIRFSNKSVLPASFKWVLILTLVSAYGMLVSFYLQGYKAISISFSTLFILVSYRFTNLVFKSRMLDKGLNQFSSRLLKGSLVFLCLSSAGPFALGPLMATGFKNTPWYQDAIYIYLHFQMNGFMLLAVLGLLASQLPLTLSRAGKTWLNLFIYSTVPLYFIFTLWSRPGIVFQLFAGLGTAVNAVSWVALCVGARKELPKCSALARTALIATTLKTIFQLFVCFPSLGEWVFSNRDLIVGYIHLLTLGIITPLILDQMIKGDILKMWSPVVWTYIGAAVAYPALLFSQPALALFGIAIPNYQPLLFGISLLFLFTAVIFLGNVRHANSPPKT